MERRSTHATDEMGFRPESLRSGRPSRSSPWTRSGWWWVIHVALLVPASAAAQSETDVGTVTHSEDASASDAPAAPPPAPSDATDSSSQSPEPSDERPESPDEPSEVSTEADPEHEPAVRQVDAADCSTEGLSRHTIRYRLESIDIRGNDSTRDAVIQRHIAVEAGQEIDIDNPALDEIRFRLLGTGYFDSVELRLERGSSYGHVVLIVEVVEQTTIRIERIALGLSQGVDRSSDLSADLLPYAGLTISERNLLGLGTRVSLSGLISKQNQGFELRAAQPGFLGSEFELHGSAFLNDAQEFFGNDPLVAVECPEPVDPTDECPPEVEARNAVVFYQRFGGSLGLGYDVAAASHLSLDWYAELVDVDVRPDAASELRGAGVEPLSFNIEEELSLVSTLRVGYTFDDRDNPTSPQEGTLLRLQGMLGSRLLGSSYSFARIQGQVRHWIPLPGFRHRLRLSGFAGTIFGEAPFFHRFFVSDLTDLVPSRVLLMSVDRRAAPNLLGTAISEMRSEDLAARVDVEYAAQILRGGGVFRSLEAYANVGLYFLADRSDLQLAIPGFRGLARVPIDLTFDVGIRMQTELGVFQLGFSNLLGFFPVFSE